MIEFIVETVGEDKHVFADVVATWCGFTIRHEIGNSSYKLTGTHHPFRLDKWKRGTYWLAYDILDTYLSWVENACGAEIAMSYCVLFAREWLNGKESAHIKGGDIKQWLYVKGVRL